MAELLVLLCGIFVVFIAIGGEYNTPEPVKHVSIEVKPAKQTKQKKSTKTKKSDPTWDEAKKTIVSFGFSATEAKKMLEGINANDVNTYVNEAMKKIDV